MDIDLEKLVSSSQQGDRESFGKLYDLFVKKIFRYIYYRTYRRDLSEDLASLTFLKALEKINTYKPERGAFSAWLYRIAHNALMDHYRQTTNMVDIDDVWDLAGNKNVELDAENRLQWEKLKPYLEKLTSREREVIVLRIWDELSYREISGILGKSEASCKMTFSRAVRFLRKEMPEALLLILLVAENRLLP